MKHLETHDGWMAVMRDLCRWTSKERQAELARNETRVARERRDISLPIVRAGNRDARRQWNAIRSASRRGVVKGLQSRKDFSWQTYENQMRRYGESNSELVETADWVIRQSKTAGK